MDGKHIQHSVSQWMTGTLTKPGLAIHSETTETGRRIHQTPSNLVLVFVAMNEASESNQMGIHGKCSIIQSVSQRMTVTLTRPVIGIHSRTRNTCSIIHQTSPSLVLMSVAINEASESNQMGIHDKCSMPLYHRASFAEQFLVE